VVNDPFSNEVCQSHFPEVKTSHLVVSMDPVSINKQASQINNHLGFFFTHANNKIAESTKTKGYSPLLHDNNNEDGDDQYNNNRGNDGT